jgi:flavin-dependent dehydrogenase
MKAKLDCDVIIAGAGPAGAATAIHMSRAGLEVILIDSRVFPRDKVCGDFVSPVALHELRALGVTSMPAYKRSHVIRHELAKSAVELTGEVSKHAATSAKSNKRGGRRPKKPETVVRRP